MPQLKTHNAASFRRIPKAKGAGRGERMVYVATDGDRRSGPGVLSYGKLGVVAVAFAVASGAAALIAGFNPSAMVMASVPPPNASLNFDDRFQPIPTRAAVNLSPRLLVQSWSSELQLKLRQAKTNSRKSCCRRRRRPPPSRSPRRRRPFPTFRCPGRGRPNSGWRRRTTRRLPLPLLSPPSARCCKSCRT